jgi:ubiquinone/menaquinone biosynthesis C-methylase UbiE
MPKGMVQSGTIATIILLLLFVIFGLSGVVSGPLQTVLFIVFLVGTVIGFFVSVWTILMYRAFSYDGKRQMSRQIIEGIAEHVKLPEGGKGLDVGCGSGALIIACAKRNPQASFVGIDRWGKEYASFNKPLCESNAKAEGVDNVSFARGDATSLDFPDESFDAVVSNYVYHNIPGDRQAYLMETLRVLKKGGTFALHDIFSKLKYGDMSAFVEKLKSMGYEEVRLIDTTDGTFMSKSEANWMGMTGSALLIGRK